MKSLGTLALMMLSFASYAVPVADITGLWYDDTEGAKMQIYQSSDGKYYGKVVWMKEPNVNGKPKLDTHNSKAYLRTRPIMGMEVLTGFTKDGDTYKGGTVYDPQDGKTYSAKMKLDGPNKLRLRGFIAVTLIGRTTVWTRAKD